MPNINQFLGILKDEYGDHIYRKIDVWRDKNGKKQTRSAHSQWTREQIADNVGVGNTYDIYIKHCKNEAGQLVCFDLIIWILMIIHSMICSTRNEQLKLTLKRGATYMRPYRHYQNFLMKLISRNSIRDVLELKSNLLQT